MSATTINTKAKAATKAPASPPRIAKLCDAITVKPFTVPVEWVEIKVMIPADLADAFDQRPEAIRSRYGEHVLALAIEVCNRGKSGESPAEIHAQLKRIPMTPRFIENDLLPPRGKRLREFTVRMQEWAWNRTCDAAKLLGVSEAAFVRAALCERRRGLLRFDEAQAARAKGGQA